MMASRSDRDRDRRPSGAESKVDSDPRRRTSNNSKPSREDKDRRDATRAPPAAIVDEPLEYRDPYREGLDRPQYASPSTFLRAGKSSGQSARSPSGAADSYYAGGSQGVNGPSQSQARPPRGFDGQDARGDRDRVAGRGEGVRLRGYSSSSSSSYIDISRTFPAKRPRGLGAIRAFFTTPPEHRRTLRRRKSRRGLAFGGRNSSSSSINSDLAYGTGFVKRRKGERRRRSLDGYAPRVDASDAALMGLGAMGAAMSVTGKRQNQRDMGHGSGVGGHNEVRMERSDRSDGERRKKKKEKEKKKDPRDEDPDAKILALGLGMAALAKRQNTIDLMQARQSGSIPIRREDSARLKGMETSSRGIGSSKINKADEDGWYSDDSDSETSSVDSRLAYGSTPNFFGFGGKRPAPPSRKSSIVDPKLFGPQNSLNGIVNRPVGLEADEIDIGNLSDYRPPTVAEAFKIARRESMPTESVVSGTNTSASLRHVFPVSTSDPTRFEVASAQRTPRPDPVPIQHPKPYTPVSKSVYDSSYVARDDSGYKKSGSVAGAALAGVAGAAIGAAIMSDRRRDDERDDRDRKERRSTQDYESEKRSSRRRDDRDAPIILDDRERRDKRREERNDPRDDRRESRRYSDRPSEKDSSRPAVTTGVDPFQFQVSKDAFPTPDAAKGLGQFPEVKRARSPAVITVERVPHFARGRSDSVKDKASPVVDDLRKERESRDRERTERDADETYKEIEHFTAPIEIGAIGAAVAAEREAEHRHEREDEERRRRRDEDDDSDPRRHREGRRRTRDAEEHARSPSRSREPSPDRDPIQEEADRIYREAVLARKIAGRKAEKDPVVRITTPPEMDHKHDASAYDAPNADFLLDHVMDPTEFNFFTPITEPGEYPLPKSIVTIEDENVKANKRPLLTLVRPTPTPSPSPEHQQAKSESKKKSEQKKVAEPTKEPAKEPKTPVSSNGNRSVTWGENETKHYEPDSPDEARTASKTSVSRDDSKPKKPSRWGAVKGAFTGAGAAGAVAATTALVDAHEKKQKAEKEEPKPEPFEYRGVVVEPELSDDEKARGPPAVGPKPPSPQPRSPIEASKVPSSHMPGSFGDDLDFTATVAAGLQDSGFDPNIVIDDPKYRRRSSPPGTNDDSKGLYKQPYAETVSDLGIHRKPEQEISTQKSIIEEVEPENTSRDIKVEPEDEFSVKLTKKEQRKRDKAAKKQSSGDDRAIEPLDETPVTGTLVEEPESYFEPAKSKKDKKSKKSKKSYDDDDIDDRGDDQKRVSVPIDAYDDLLKNDREPETPIADEWDTPSSKKSKKKSKRDSERYDSPARSVDVYDDQGKNDREPETPVAAADEWDVPSSKKSKKKSKRDSESYDSPSRSVATSEIGEESSSKKSKDKSKRKSESYEPDVDPADIMLPASEVSTRSSKDKSKRYEPDVDPADIMLPASEVSTRSDESGKSKKSKRDSSIHDDRSTRSDSVRGDDESRRSKKSSRRDSSLPDEASQVSSRVSSRYDEDDDTRSTTSSKKKEKEKEKKNGGFFGLFGSSTSKSEPEPKDDFEEPKKKKKSKRSSTIDSDTFVDAPSYANGNEKYDDAIDSKKATNGDKAREVDDEDTHKKDHDSFLGNAGTLGAGVGLVGAIALAAQHQHSKAALADDEDAKSLPIDPFQYQVDSDAFSTPEAGRTTDPFMEYRPLAHISAEQAESLEDDKPHARDLETPGGENENAIDPEIAERQFRPSIDPQYGDLLPLPPSDPATPGTEPANPISELPSLPESRPNSPPRLEKFTPRERPSALSRRSEHSQTHIKSPSTSAIPLKFMLGNRSTPTSPRVVGPGPSLGVGMSPVGSPAVASPESMTFPTRPRARPTSWEGSKERQPLILLDQGRKRDSGDAEKFSPTLHSGSDTTQEFGIDGTLARSKSVSDELHADEKPSHHSGSLASAAIAGSVFGLGAGALASSLARDKEAHNERDLTANELKEDSTRPSPVDSVTKDRTSYLFQSTPPTKGFGKVDDTPLEESFHAERATSPTGHRGLGLSDEFNVPTDSSRAVQESRDHGSSTVDFATHNEPVSSENKSVDNDKDLEAAIDEPPPMEADAAEDFSFTKSKKGKKDKKKKQTFDQLLAEEEAAPLPSPPVEAVEEADPMEEFSLPKSKKDKKKDKKQTIDQLLAEEEPVSLSAFSPPITVEPVEELEFAMPKSKKDKKKAKKSVVELLDEAEVSANVDQEATPFEDSLQKKTDAEPDFEFSMPKSKKDKKKDKKKGKQIDDEPESMSSSIVLPPIEDMSKDIDPLDEFAMPKSKKDKKKDKKKGKQQDDESESLSNSLVLPPKDEVSRELEPEPEISSQPSKTQHEEMSAVHDHGLASEPVTEEGAPEPEAEPVDDFSFTKSKKDKKKDKKGRKSLSRTATEDDFASSEPTAALHAIEGDIPDSHAAALVTPLLSDEVVVPEDVVADTGDIPANQRDFVPENEAFEGNSSSKSKKDKKKDKKSRKTSQAWDAEDSVPDETSKEIVPEAAIDAPMQEDDSFIMPPSKKKGKKSKRQSIAWENDEEPETPIEAQVLGRGVVDEPTDQLKSSTPIGATPSDSEPFGTARSNFSNPEYFPSGALLPLAAAGAGLAALSHHHGEEQLKEEHSEFPDVTSSIERSAVVSETPLATSDSTYFPAATSLYEDRHTPTTAAGSRDGGGSLKRQEPSADYFPSAASLHSPKKSGFKDDAEQRGYFPSAAAILPLTAAPTLVGADAVESGVVQKGEQHHEQSKGLGMDEQSSMTEKSLSKDMTMTGSEEPSVDAKIPPGYSEEQLEIARQMKADFESGVLGRKKSKKGKKGKSDLSRTSTQDEETFQTLPDETAEKDLPAPYQEERKDDIAAPESQSKDGLAAGFNAEQILLAKQLQAEFGAGDKKSKKGKKSRSTSRTPRGDFDSQDSYFDEPQVAEPEQIQELSRDVGPSREASPSLKGPDGLVAGFTAEQLEAARQMREDFSSGSMKTKKELKKDKKRQSLLRTVTDDNFGKLLDEPEEDSLASSEVNSPTDSGASTPNVREELEEFSFATPKKGKKGKKRQSSLLRTSIVDDEAPETSRALEATTAAPIEDVAIQNFEEAQALETTEPAEEFSYSSKKSKKDKKGKKRQTSTFDDEPSAEVAPDASKDFDDTELDIIKPSLSQEISEPVDDEFSYPSKKSKKDKKGKKRETSTFDDDTPSPAAPDSVIEPDLDMVDTIEPKITKDIEDKPSETTEPAEEESYSLKKSKKDKKSKKRQTSTFDEEESYPAQSAEPDLSLAQPIEPIERDIENKPLETAEPADEEFYSLKKSKKDKKGKKRQTSTFDDEEPSPAAQQVAVEPDVVQLDPIETKVDHEIEDKPLDTIEPAEEEFYSLKKSKKDKKSKKRQTADFDDVEPVIIVQDAKEPEFTQPDVVESTTGNEIKDELTFETVDPDEEDPLYSLKKSKKDKKSKKRQSSSATPIESEPSTKEQQEEFVLDSTTPGRSLADQIWDSVISTDKAPSPTKTDTPAAESDDPFGFSMTSKKSKKGKKNKKGSGAATPFEDDLPGEPLQQSLPEGQETLQDEEQDKQISRDLVIEPNTVQTEGNDPTEEVDDWAGFSTSKKSKKDKKKKGRADSKILEDVQHEGSTFEAVKPTQATEKSAPLSWADEVAEAEEPSSKGVTADTQVEVHEHDKNPGELETARDILPDTVIDGKTPVDPKSSKSHDIESYHISIPEQELLEKTDSSTFVGPSDDKHNDGWKIAAAAGAAGAAVAGAALLSRRSEESLEDRKHSEPATTVPYNLREEDLAPKVPEITQPVSKKDKKGKGKGKKKSLDRRSSTQDDIFDDPSLWEGAEPKNLDDDKNERAQEDGGDFWSVPADAEAKDVEAKIPIMSTAERLEQQAKEDPQTSEPPRQVSQLRQMFEKEAPQEREVLKEEPQEREVLKEEPQEREMLKETAQTREPHREIPQIREDSEFHEAPQPRLPLSLESPQIREHQVPITDVTEPGHKRAHDEVVDAALVAAGIHSPAAIDEALEQNVAKGKSYQSGGVVPEQQWNDLPDDLVRKPSKKSKKNKKQSRLAAWDIPTNEGESTVVEASLNNIPQPEPLVAPADIQKQGWSFPTTPTEDREIIEPSSSRVREPGSSYDENHGEHQERNVPDMPKTPENRSYDSLKNQEPRWSSPRPLPVVIEEESPDQPRFVRTSPEPELRTRDRGFEDTNRDSGLVTGSPIPLHRATFRDDHEDVRDSGVHLREWSDSTPIKEKREIALADEALARMSWPAVDEESETVDLDRSQRHKDQAPPKHSSAKGALGAAAALAGAGIAVKGARSVSDKFEEKDSDKKVRPERRSVSDKFDDKEKVSDKRTRSDRRSISPNFTRLQTPDYSKHRPGSVGSNRSTASGTPPLRRSDRKLSGDLRSLSQRSQANLAKEAREAELLPSPATSIISATPIVANEGRVRAKDMADVYDGFGEGRIGSPMSPTRPHSMRRRQSMQVLDLETRLKDLEAENRALAEAKAFAEQSLHSSHRATSVLADREAEVDNLKQTIDWLHKEVEKLKEVNDGLTSANIALGHQHNQRYDSLATQHEQATRELDEARTAHGSLSGGMETIVRNEVEAATYEKDREIEQLRKELEAAKEQIREMQRQILAAKANDSEFLVLRDEDYFDNACQQLCQHVQQWVLRFSKFSDMRACRLTSEINNDKIIDRLDNAVLDGSDVDTYLSDRVKRRDIFMSMTMTMVWEFVFTRYLFGMDREQRQKLKALEKTLSEVGPPSAVHQWRATTLTLLAKRPAFIQQREQDTEAVVQLVFGTLSEILPPPTQLEDQIQEQLRRVMKAAVDLSIEMRTQRAEYMMLPPLQPEYDANGDLAQQVHFNAALMNERSGDTSSNEELEAQQAVVRVVLFPLVVKKGDDSGEGDDEIVVCPAQVLVANAKGKKSVRVFSPEAMDLSGNHSRVSMQSGMPMEQVQDI